MVDAAPDHCVDAYVALGSNLGDRAAAIRRALDALGDARGVCVAACSRVLETAPVGGPPGQPAYLNAVAQLRTSLDPPALLDVLLEIERRLGRVRCERSGPRTIDLDLLLHGDARIESESLTLPHPRMWTREFVLAPLRDLCGRRRFSELVRRFAPADAPEAAPC